MRNVEPLPDAPASLARHVPPNDPAPRRVLKTIDVIAIIVGIVIGAGIFSAPALVASNAGSAAQMLSAWLIGGFIALAGTLCYAELTTTYPSAGGEYYYLRLAFGERLAFLFAWARLTVIPTGSIAILGYIFGDYASQIWKLGSFSSALYAALMVLALTTLNVLGLKAGKTTQNLLTLLEVGGILLIIAVGFWAAPTTSSLPIFTSPSSTSNWGLILIFVMLTYGGWNEAAYISAEVLGPNRSLPRALIWSLALITVLYMLVNMAYLNVLSLTDMASSTAVAADMMRRVLGESGAQLIATLIAISALTSANATILTAARTNYAFGRDTPMFSALGRWHPTRNAPTTALWVQAGIALILVLIGALTRSGFATMVEYTAPVFWFFFLMTGIALFVLRKKYPQTLRPFKVPLYPLTPLLFCATSGYLLYASVRHTGVGALVGVFVVALGVLLLLVRRPARTIPAS
ncbi:MAG TPA: amino acid permease [Eoetvoesiella sp.]